MRVVTASLGTDDVDTVVRACESAGLGLKVRDDLTAALELIREPTVTLALLVGVDDTPPEEHAAPLRVLGEQHIYAIAVVPARDERLVSGCLSAGFGLALVSPVNGHRLEYVLDYWQRVAPPTAAQVLHLDRATRQLRAHGSATATVSDDQFELLMALGEKPDRIVHRSQLRSELAAAAPALVNSLRREKLQPLGSAARIITVPGVGYRLVGVLEVS